MMPNSRLETGSSIGTTALKDGEAITSEFAVLCPAGITNIPPSANSEQLFGFSPPKASHAASIKNKQQRTNCTLSRRQNFAKRLPFFV